MVKEIYVQKVHYNRLESRLQIEKKGSEERQLSGRGGASGEKMPLAGGRLANIGGTGHDTDSENGEDEADDSPTACLSIAKRSRFANGRPERTHRH